MESDVGRLVAECIEHSGLNARQVAARAGVAASTVHRILNGPTPTRSVRRARRSTTSPLPAGST